MISGREFDNFTYEIENAEELSKFVAQVLGTMSTDAEAPVHELERDGELEAAIAALLRGRRDRNQRMPFGRRLGWYALARLRKPRLVVETGVHDGLGSIALLKALERNAEEGHPGELLSFDIDPRAGWLIPDFLRSRHTLVVGDARACLPRSLADRRVDMFVHDSDHRYEHESVEFELIMEHAGQNMVLISDNAHASTAFEDHCRRHGLDFAFWRETPRNHFYPGAGIGAAVVRAAAADLNHRERAASDTRGVNRG